MDTYGLTTTPQSTLNALSPAPTRRNTSGGATTNSCAGKAMSMTSGILPQPCSVCDSRSAINKLNRQNWKGISPKPPSTPLEVVNGRPRPHTEEDGSLKADRSNGPKLQSSFTTYVCCQHKRYATLRRKLDLPLNVSHTESGQTGADDCDLALGICSFSLETDAKVANLQSRITASGPIEIERIFFSDLLEERRVAALRNGSGELRRPLPTVGRGSVLSTEVGMMCRHALTSGLFL